MHASACMGLSDAEAARGSPPIPTSPPNLPLALPQGRASRQLPGAQTDLLGVAPSVWVVLPGNPHRPHPAGAMLVRVEQQARWPAAAPGAAQPGLRLVAYSSDDGSLLECRERLAQHESMAVRHPRFGVPAWDSG